MNTENIIVADLDNAEDTGFISKSDLNDIAPGKSFEIIWRFKNNGTTTWNKEYKLAYTLTPHVETIEYPRLPLSRQTSWAISDIGAATEVRPSDTMELRLTFTVPAQPGTYATNWQLQSPNGQRFGPNKWLRVVVVDKDENVPEHEENIHEPDRATDHFQFKAWPTEYYFITQPFGVNKANYEVFNLPGHEGIDLRAPFRTKIFAVADGFVREVGDDRQPKKAGGHNYGVRIYIDHENGYESIYAHLDERLVERDDKIKAGDHIGWAGSTGNSDAAHLHLTLKHKEAYRGKNGKPNGAMYADYPYNIIDPTPYLEPLIRNQNQKEATSEYHYAVAEDGLNLRSEPATIGGQATIIQLLPNHTKVAILDTVSDLDPNTTRQWHQVQVGEKQGFIAADYVSQRVSIKKTNSHEVKVHILETGMNINPDAPHSNPVSSKKLQGMNWVRLVFKVDDRRAPETGQLEKAFAQYDAIVKGYNEQGVKTLFIINQETRQPRNTHQNWREAQHWETYCAHLANTSSQIAAHYKNYGESVAYQIWNEGDKSYQPGQTDVKDIPSVFLPPGDMALMLKKVAKAIRDNAPKAKIIFNGMATGPDQSISYWQACKKALNGPWPVDALAVHPYTRIATQAGAPFDWGENGRFLKDAFNLYHHAFPNMPIWITEVGVAVDDGTAVSTDYAYREIAKYMKDIYQYVSKYYSDLIPVIIWFAWSDNMRNAGMVKSDGSEKPHLFDVFKEIRDRTSL